MASPGMRLRNRSRNSTNTCDSPTAMHHGEAARRPSPGGAIFKDKAYTRIGGSKTEVLVVRGQSMPVTHLRSVVDFEKCLKHGGTHKFEITVDEMPHLSMRLGTLSPLKVHDFQTQELMKQQGTWAALVRQLAALNAVWVYRRSGELTYEVTCIIPPPGDRA